MFAIASVFAIVGGFLDAYSYLARGHVFANAQTGNVVLLGVRAAAGNWTSAQQRHDHQQPPQRRIRLVATRLGETDPKLRGEAVVGSVIFLCFVAGALVGGVCTLRLQAYPLFPAVVLAAAGTLLTIRERERSLP